MSGKSSYLHHFLDDSIIRRGGGTYLFTSSEPIDVCSQNVVTMFIMSQVSRTTATCHTCLLNVSSGVNILSVSHMMNLRAISVTQTK